MNRNLVSIIILCLCFSIGLSAQTAPDFTITTPQGKTVKLYELLNQGKSVVLKFFFTTCPPCNAVAPELQTLYSKLSTTGKVEFIALSVQSWDTNDLVKKFDEKYGITFPSAGAEGGSLTAIQPYTNDTFGAFQGTPTFAIIKPDKTVKFNVAYENLEAELQLSAVAGININGKIQTEYQTPVKDAFVYAIDSLTTTIYRTKSDSLGNYKFDNISATTNFIYVVKEDSARTDVSTADIIQISRHILGLKTFSSFFKQIAADVSFNNVISVTDVVELRKLILRVVDNFQNNRVWRFFHIKSDIAYEAVVLGGQSATYNFTAVKTGDVSYTCPTGITCFDAENNVESRNKPVFELFTADKTFQKGDNVRIEIKSSALERFMGLQGLIRFNPTALEFSSIESSILSGLDDSFLGLKNVKDGELLLSWNDFGNQNLSTNSELLTLHFIAQRTGKLSDVFLLSNNGLKPEAYNDFGQVFDMKMRFLPENTSTFWLGKNPIQDNIHLNFQLEEESPLTVNIFNQLGQIIDTQQFNRLEKGFNQIQFDAANWSSGLYFISIEGENIQHQTLKVVKN